VAVIKDGVDAGGSYVFVQRWEHNLKQLNRMSVPDQEMMIGRTKEANEEIDGDDRPVTSHLSRVDLKEDGKGLKIVVRACRTAPPAAPTASTFAPTARVCITLNSSC
jgi:putative iron-dependent peroxidase